MSVSPIVAIVGPTASGKSTVALSVAQARGGEIISCDSVQVYADFVIGCAKPTLDERALVRHHLLDVAQWNEPFDAQRYRCLAVGAIADIRARQRQPIVCGGTGLYLRTLRWGLVDAPAAQPELRASLYADEQQHPGALHKRLLTLDPVSAERIGPKNLVHLVRALEISLMAGEPASLLRARHGFAREEIAMHLVAMDWPTHVLRARIAERVASMINEGLLAEVAQLLARGVAADARPMRSLGYKETSDVLLGKAPRQGLEDRITQATYAYARRQRTWWRRERNVTWLDVHSIDEAHAAVLALLSSVES